MKNLFGIIFSIVFFQNLYGQVSEVKLKQLIKEIDRDNYTSAEQYSFLSPIVEDVSLVMLGESIHLTHEFPLVRIGMIKYLNENENYNIIAMEGGAADIWVAQDILFDSQKEEADFKKATSGFFFIWNTPEIQKLIEYQASSLGTSNPLYITAYDVQQGTGQGSKNTKVFEMLAERLSYYSKPPTDFDLEKWLDQISPITFHCMKYNSSDYHEAISAINILEEWIQTAAPKVKKQYPNIPHDVVLKSMPDNFRASLSLCETLGGFNLSRYKVVRDSLSYINTLDLIKSAPNNKIIIWAHLSHVYYDSYDNIIPEVGEWNDIAVGPTVGERLKKKLGSKVYTIIPFAESGKTILIYNDLNLDIGYGKITNDQSDFGKLFTQLSQKDFFLDLNSSNLSKEKNPRLFSKQLFLIEGMGELYLNFSSDMDGLIWIKKIGAPDWPRFKIILLSSLHYKKQLAVVLIVGLGWLVFSKVRKSRNNYSKNTDEVGQI